VPSFLRHHEFSEEQYLDFERHAASRSEFYRGHVLAMAGGSPAHARLCANIIGVLYAALRGKPCQASSSDQRLATPDRLFTYPDVGVYCGSIELLPGTTDVATNPTVLVEVLSDGTRAYDCGDKLQKYQEIPSLRAVLLVEPGRAEVSLVLRGATGWKRETIAGLDAVARLEAISVDLPLREVYAGVVGPVGPLIV
jgi:Uma2 family endonuclease